MKNKTIVKIIAMAVALAALSAIAFAVSAEETEVTKPEIYSQNVEYGEKFSLMYAVDASTVTGDTVTLTVTGGDATWSKTVDATAENQVTVKDKAAYVFITPGVSATEFTKQYYATASSGDATSDVKRYSIGEYLYERLYANGIVNAESGTKEYNKKVFYENVLAMGASAQIVLVNDKKAEGEALETLVTDYRYVSVTGGTLSDGYTAGIFEKGTTVTVNHTAEAPEGQALVGWAAGSALYTTASFELNDHAVISPSYCSGVIDFENDKIPMSYELNSTDSAMFVTTQHGRKAAYLRTYSDGADSITFTPTVMAEDDYNTVVFDTMIQLQHNGPSTTYFQNFTFTDAEGNVAYKFTLRHGDAGMQFNDGTSNEQLVIAAKNTWFNLRIEYTYIDENTVTINTYVDDVLKFSSTNFVGDTAIKDVCIFKHTTDTGIGASIFYDDVSMKQIKK